MAGYQKYMKTFSFAYLLGFVLFAFGSLLLLPAEAQVTKNVTYRDDIYTTEIRFDVQKIEKSLVRLRSQRAFPPLFPDGKVYSSNNRLSRTLIPDFIQSKFEKIQMAVFGKPDVLKLLSCDGCEPNIEVGNMSVFIDPTWIDSILKDSHYRNPLSFIEFVLAHEVSHYIYESEIINSTKHLSPNEQKSYFFVRLHNEEFVQSLFSLSEGSEKNKLLRESVLEETSRHAEIDSIAKVILDNLKVESQCDVVTWLRSWTTIPDAIENAVGGIAFTRINAFKNTINVRCP